MSDQAKHLEQLREAFEQECRRSAPGFLMQRRKQSCSIDALDRMVGALGRLAVDLQKLIADSEHLPVEQIEPAIRQIIEQRGYLAEAGDLCDTTAYRVQVDLYVIIVARVIRRMRNQQTLGGKWADAPVTPMMFG